MVSLKQYLHSLLGICSLKPVLKSFEGRGTAALIKNRTWNEF